MSSRPYNGFYISVRAVHHVHAISSRNPAVKISVKEEGAAVASLYSTLEFPTDKDAEVYGFEMGVKWVDSR